MKCSKAQRYLDLMASGSLEPGLKRELQLHLDACDGCRGLYQVGKNLIELAKRSPQAGFPSWLHQRIMSQVKEHEQRRIGYARRWKLQTIPATLAVLLSLYVGTLVGIKAHDTSSQSVAQSTQSVELASFGESTLVDLDANGGGYNE